MLALAATGVHAASSGTMGMFKFAPGKDVAFKNIELTAEQKVAVEQAQALRKQADDILEKAGLPIRHPMMGMKMMQRPELTAEQKATLEQVRKLHEEGKNDEAKALLETAGLPAGPHGMKFKHMESKIGEVK